MLIFSSFLAYLYFCYMIIDHGHILPNSITPLKGGGGGGVQAYNFGNFNYEIRVDGEGQDTSRIF